MFSHLNACLGRSCHFIQGTFSRFALAIILAPLAGGIWALAPSAGDRQLPLALPPAKLAVQPATGDVTGVGVTIQRVGERDSQSIDALTATIARRYRVSEAAIHELVKTAYDEARRNKLDPLLVVAVIAIESRFNPIAQSEMGATGLMQVIPQYHADKFAANDGESMLDPHVNIRVGSRVLREYIARGGTEAAGLRLYNGSSEDSNNVYPNKVAVERQRLQTAIRRAGGQALPGRIA